MSWCAPASVQNALEFYGRRVGQKSLAKLMGETGDGCDHRDIMSALESLGCGFQVFESYDRRESLNWVSRACGVWPLILCVDDYNHWVCVVRGVGDYLLLIDPTLNERKLVRPTNRKVLVRRWKASREASLADDDGGALYYGIAITRPPG